MDFKVGPHYKHNGLLNKRGGGVHSSWKLNAYFLKIYILLQNNNVLLKGDVGAEIPQSKNTYVPYKMPRVPVLIQPL